MAHKTHEELTQLLNEAATLLSKNTSYKHYKNPSQTYRIIGFAILESDDSVGVIYEAEYGDHIPFIRPISSFLETVEVEGKMIPRFTKA